MSHLGHLRKRKDKNGRNRYQMIVEVWSEGKKFYKSKTFSTEKEAKSWGNKKRYEIENGLVSKESLKNRKLADAIAKFLSHELPRKPKNASNIKQHLLWWDGQLGHHQFNDVSSKSYC